MLFRFSSPKANGFLRLIVGLLFILSVIEAWPVINIQILECDPKNAHQQWTINTNPPTILVGVGVDNQNDCLDCNGCTEATIPHTWPCDPKNPNQNQVWLVTPSKPNSPLRSQNVPNECLTVFDAISGSSTIMQDCSKNNPFSLWTYEASTKLFRLSSNTSLCLDTTPTAYSCDKYPFSTYAYCNESLDAFTRVRDLRSRVTSNEKAINLQNANPGIPRLGVPPIPFSEALHGVVSGCIPGNPPRCPTSFPHALLLGSTFNRTLWRSIGNRISTEARALNNKGIAGIAYWAPDINLFRDPRWGRGQEVPGEDPFLTGEYVMHYSRGMQEGDDPRYIKVVSTAKHYADYDLEGNWGVDRGSFNAIVNDQDQVEYYWPAFRAAVEGAHIHSIMCSYNAVNDVPSCGNNLFMNVVARGQWQFDGFIVSDCGAIADGAFTRYINEHYNGSADYQVRQGIVSGCDLNCGSYYATHITTSVSHGVLKQSDVDRAFDRVWSHAIRLGMLDKYVSYRTLGPENVDNDEHRKLALDAAIQGIILLKNDGNLLPLNAKKTRVAVLGPHFDATQDLLSIYRGDNILVNSHSPLQAIQARGVQIVGAAPGCDLSTNDKRGFDLAVSIAQKADVALVFVGLHPGQGQTPAREDEGWDRNSLVLPGVQEDLVKAIAATKVPTVVVLIHGGALAIEWIKNNIPAIVDAHYPGELGGDAITSILFGDVSPAGRLVSTIYPADFINVRNISDMNLRDKGGITYRYYTGKPLWEFGFGLSYTTFNFSVTSANHFMSTTKQMKNLYHNYYKLLNAGNRYFDPVYEVTVTNTGNVVSDVVVLGFVSSGHANAPIRELFGFDRVANLKPGENETVYFSVPPTVLSLVDREGTEQIHPGTYYLTFGDSLNVAKATLTLTGEIETVLSLNELKKQHLKNQNKIK